MAIKYEKATADAAALAQNSGSITGAGWDEIPMSDPILISAGS
jgi:hypothetical protein